MPAAISSDVTQKNHLAHGAFHPEAAAVNADGAARILGVCTAHIYALHNTGRLPLPFRMGRAVRWSRAELTAWVAAGAPSRAKWETIKAK